MKLTSTFAMLDVKEGRQELAQRVGFDVRPHMRERIPVTITGYIIGQWGHGDRSSIEFQVQVENVKVRD